MRVDQFLQRAGGLTLEGRDELFLIHAAFVPLVGKRFNESVQLLNWLPTATARPDCEMSLTAAFRRVPSGAKLFRGYWSLTVRAPSRRLDKSTGSPMETCAD